MQRSSLLCAAALGPQVVLADRSRFETTTNPITKVLKVLADIEAKVIRDGKEEQVAFERYSQWCQTGGKEKEYEIKTAKSDIEDLTATITKATSDISSSAGKIEALAQEVSTSEVDLKTQTAMRKKENDEFMENEKELVETIDTLERATNVLQRKMRGSALLEAKFDKKDLKTLISTLNQVVNAAGLALHDRQKLLALAQSDEDDDSEYDDDAMGTPAAAAYEKKSGSIIDVLEDLKEKAEMQLTDLRRQEVNAQHNFEMTKQSLDDQMKADSKELDDAKAIKNGASETKAQAQGELDVTKKDLATAQATLKNMDMDCKMVAKDNEASSKSRVEELKAIAAAKKALNEMTSGATSATYSFLQEEPARGDFNVVNMVRKLAHDEHSAAISQLAVRLSSAIKEGNVNGEDPFAKVKGLIKDMIARLEKEGSEDATHKAYCDKEFGETKKKLEELKYDVEKFSSKIDKSKSESSRLKGAVAEIQREIAEISKSQANADALRQDEHKAYVETKADLEQGLEGLRMALKVLRDYYAKEEDGGAAMVQQPEMPGTHSAAEGAGGGVIAMLEVVQSDFSKNLAAIELEEATSQNEYERATHDNRVAKVSKEQDTKYKTKEAASLDKSITEMNSDLESAQTELDAVLEYKSKVRGMCEMKPDTYASRRGRRQAEIEGLKAAMEALNGAGQTELIQHPAPGSLRGVAVAHHVLSAH